MGTDFNYEKDILKYINSTDKLERIVALFMRAKKMKPENVEQTKSIINRHLNSAKDLESYSDKKIIRTMKYLIDNADFKWTISTLLKYIDEDMEDLDGKKPIITLKDGERIYEVGRLKDLEKSGRIYYEGTTWRER